MRANNVTKIILFRNKHVRTTLPNNILCRENACKQRYQKNPTSNKIVGGNCGLCPVSLNPSEIYVNVVTKNTVMIIG